MISKHFNMLFPAPNSGYNRVGVIKAIRQITGLGLKDAKDLTEKQGVILVKVVVNDIVDHYTGHPIPEKRVLEDALAELRRNGVMVNEAVRAGTLEEVRKLASDALLRDELDLAVALIDIIRRFN
jgi:hypothetical protein